MFAFRSIAKYRIVQTTRCAFTASLQSRVGRSPAGSATAAFAHSQVVIAAYSAMSRQKAIQSFSQDPAKTESLEHLIINDVEVPDLGDGQVLVRMKLRPVNPTDIAQAKGAYGDKGTFTIGSEGVGVVEKVGPGVKSLKEGQRVVAGGWPSGTWQQYLAVPGSELLVVPDAVDDKTAAQFYINPTTIVGMLEVSDVPKGEWFLQTAASSVLGRQLVQYAKHMGVKTINVVRRQEQIDELKALGADEVINTEEEDLVARVKEITGGKGAYAAVDPVGGELTAKVLSALRKGGTVRVYGTLSGNTIGPFNTRDVMAGRNVTGFIIYSWLPGLGAEGKRRKLEEVLQLLADGVMKPYSGQAFPFEQYKEAIRESVKPGRGAKVFLEG